MMSSRNQGAIARQTIVAAREKQSVEVFVTVHNGASKPSVDIKATGKTAISVGGKKI